MRPKESAGDKDPKDVDSSRLTAIGFSKPNASELTSCTVEGIREASLPDLLVRALARGDEHPIEGLVASVADELSAFGAVVSENDAALGTLLEGWAVRLRIAAEIVRRYRVTEG